ASAADDRRCGGRADYRLSRDDLRPQRATGDDGRPATRRRDRLAAGAYRSDPERARRHQDRAARSPRSPQPEIARHRGETAPAARGGKMSIDAMLAALHAHAADLKADAVAAIDFAQLQSDLEAAGALITELD